MAQALAELGFLVDAAPALEKLNSSKKNRVPKYKYIVIFMCFRVHRFKVVLKDEHRTSNTDKLVKSPKFRHACGGRHPELFENTGFPPLPSLGQALRGNDAKGRFKTFYGTINTEHRIMMSLRSAI